MFNIFSSTTTKKVLVSGIQATGKLHIGNYFGAMRQNIELGNSGEYEAYIFIADYHALTTVKNREALNQSALEIAAAYVACGLDPKKVTLFRQSSVPEHTELCWIFNNVVTVPYLMRAHAYKDHEAKNQEVNTGLFDYPVLMASDILMYQADLVPVGQDQKQHVEYARDIAGFYNRAWGEYFKLPKEMIMKDVAVVPGIDGEKMSKSKGNVIPLFGSDEEVKKAIMSIVTDSATPEEKKNPDTNNVYNIHKLFLTSEEDTLLRSKFEQGGGYGYKQAKEELLVTITAWRKGKKEVYDDLMTHPEKVKAILEEGGKRARTKAAHTMQEVKNMVGLGS